MKVRQGMPSTPVLEAVDWVEGLEVAYGTMVSVQGRTYLNVQEEGLNSNEPLVDGSGYTKALAGAKLIKALVELKAEKL